MPCVPTLPQNSFSCQMPSTTVVPASYSSSHVVKNSSVSSTRTVCTTQGSHRARCSRFCATAAKTSAAWCGPRRRSSVIESTWRGNIGDSLTHIELRRLKSYSQFDDSKATAAKETYANYLHSDPSGCGFGGGACLSRGNERRSGKRIRRRHRGDDPRQHARTVGHERP